jgi:hypothetical protein
VAKFAPLADPKCPESGTGFAHQNDTMTWLSAPSMIVLDVLFRFDAAGHEPEVYRVRID